MMQIERQRRVQTKIDKLDRIDDLARKDMLAMGKLSKMLNKNRVNDKQYFKIQVEKTKIVDKINLPKARGVSVEPKSGTRNETITKKSNN